MVASRLESAEFKPDLHQGSRNSHRGRFAGTTTGLLVLPNVNQALEKCPGRDDHRLAQY